MRTGTPSLLVRTATLVISTLLLLATSGAAQAATPAQMKSEAIALADEFFTTFNVGGTNRSGYDPYAPVYVPDAQLQTESTAMLLWYAGVDNLGLNATELQEIYDFFVFMKATDGWLYSDYTSAGGRVFKKWLHNAWVLAGLEVLADAGIADSAGLETTLRSTLSAAIDPNGYIGGDPDGSEGLRVKAIQSLPFYFSSGQRASDAIAIAKARLAIDFYMTNCIDANYDVNLIDNTGVKLQIVNAHEAMEFAHGLYLFYLLETDSARRATIQSNLVGILNRYRGGAWTFTNSFLEKYVSNTGTAGIGNSLAQWQLSYLLKFAAEEGWVTAGLSTQYNAIYDRVKISSADPHENNNIWYLFNPQDGSAQGANLNSYLQSYMLFALDTQARNRIAGNIDDGSNPIVGVKVTADDGGSTRQSDASGDYEVWVPDDWSGNVTPSLAEYTFAPPSRAYSNLTADVTGDDYTGSYVPDLTPPSPDPMSFLAVPTATSATTIAMVATGATDAASSPVEYFFECTNDAGASSGWRSDANYVATGLSDSTLYSFRVKARDSAGAQNQTGWSGIESATTFAPPPEKTYDFSSDAGTTHFAWGTYTDAWAQDLEGQRHAAQLNVQASYPPLAASDAIGDKTDPNRYTNPDEGSFDESTLIVEFNIAEDPADINEIDVLWEGFGDLSHHMELYIWDYVQGNWGDGAGNYGNNNYMDDGTGTIDFILSGSVTNNASNYISPAGQITLLIYDDQASQDTFHDYVSITVRSTAQNVCGNGVIEPGELCDDGNTTNGDCCDLLCQFEVAGASCSDDDACTVTDTCDGLGTCNGGAPLACDDGNGCTDDSCDPSGGCVFFNNTNACDDGDACTTNDTCGGGVCGGSTLSCDDGNACTDDACDSGTGCFYTNNVASCDDGDACTTTDSCSGGVCVGSGSLSCDDGNGCTDDSCDPGSGCVFANNTTACDDGSACTTGDACSGGVCTGSAISCDDGNICTDDSCDPGSGCVNANNGAACDDGNACTTGDSCSGGVCVGGGALSCDDGNGCTDDSCDPGSGCTYANNTAACDDGDACTTGDSCSGGACVGGGGLSCDDGNTCTDDSCDPGSGCTYANNGAACDDGDACTTTDVCSGGVCVGSGSLSCDDGNGCTDDSCDPGSGCVFANNGASCDDGNPCTTGDTCNAGLCVGGAPLSCDDGNVCTDDSCDPGSGCTYANNAASCDDGNECNTGDVCSGGVCSGTGGPACDDGNPCTNDLCEPGTGCYYENNTAGCDDGNACTTGDSCASGLCVGGPPLSCDDGNGCTDDSCDPGSGCVATNNVAACDDGNACTTSDTCSGGACVGGTPPVCDDGNPCTDDSCDPGSGCTTTNNGAACDDGNACTTADTCSGGVCVGGAPLTCDDGNGCTDDSCDPGSGCTTTNNGAACDDGNACTTADTCSGGACVGGAPLSCDDGNVCTDDSCDPGSGCTTTNNGAACDDGNACTTSDVCSGGVCTGSSPLACDDGNPCTDDSCDPGSGCTATNNVASCDDGDACTTSDTCSGGSCVGGAPLSCDDGNGCTDDSCDPGSGCVATNNTAACNDGDVCTTTDVCSGGVCVGSGTLACDDGNDCTSDQCVSGVGCQSGDLTGPACDDGDDCTLNDSCVSGICTGNFLNCSDGNPCTDDVCLPGGTCDNPNNSTQCEDGDPCTSGDTCIGGVCITGSPTVCDDGNVCTLDFCDPQVGCQAANLSFNTTCDDGDACTTGDICFNGTCVGSAPTNCDDGNVCTHDGCNPSTGCEYTDNDGESCDDGNACLIWDLCEGGVCGGVLDRDCDDGDSCTLDTCDAVEGCFNTFVESQVCNYYDQPGVPSFTGPGHALLVLFVLAAGGLWIGHDRRREQE